MKMLEFYLNFIQWNWYILRRKIILTMSLTINQNISSNDVLGTRLVKVTRNLDVVKSEFLPYIVIYHIA